MRFDAPRFSLLTSWNSSPSGIESSTLGSVNFIKFREGPPLHIGRAVLQAERNAPVLFESYVVRIPLKVSDIFVKDEKFIPSRLPIGDLHRNPRRGFMKERGAVSSKVFHPIDTMPAVQHRLFQYSLSLSLVAALFENVPSEPSNEFAQHLIGRTRLIEKGIEAGYYPKPDGVILQN